MPGVPIKNTESVTMKLILNHFLQETNKYLSQLEKHQTACEIEINKEFASIIESLPHDIKNTSFAKVKDQYSKVILNVENKIYQNLKKIDQIETETQLENKNEDNAEEEAADTDMKDETNLFDFASHLKNKDLTSTVKKTITCVKKIAPNVVNCINEEETVHYDVDEIESVPEKLFITLNIPMKDGKQKTMKLSEILDLSTDQVHADCLKEFKLIRESRFQSNS